MKNATTISVLALLILPVIASGARRCQTASRCPLIADHFCRISGPDRARSNGSGSTSIFRGD